jgi:RNA-directed DNA polymerase
MENINSWNDVNWTLVQKTVFRLQLRIYKSSKNNEIEKMHKLQRLLLRSSYAKFLATRKITQDNAGKRTPGVDKRIIKSPKDKYNLATNVKVDGKCSPISKKYIPKPDGRNRPLGIPTIEDRVKQELVYLAMLPQWEAQFEATSYGFRPGRSVVDAIENVWVGIVKKPKWVLDADISKCFDSINHKYLIEKCNTFTSIKRQIKSWLKAGILDGEEYTLPEMGPPQGGVISPLLSNIALHGLRERLDTYINSLGGHRPNNRQSLTYVRYADDFVLMHPDKETLIQLKSETEEFLKPIGLELHPEKTRIVHTLESTPSTSAGFTFLGFDVIQKPVRIKQRATQRRKESKQTFFTLIRPSKEGIKTHKKKLRDIIRRYKGTTQERLIQELNPVIRGWALAKRTVISSDIFQSLDKYMYIHLWKWARKRHAKMSKFKLKDMYWHTIQSNNWVFGSKSNNEIKLRLQQHSKISIKRHAKVKGNASPFDGNLIYWAQKTGKSLLIPDYKARLIREQHGHCGICGDFFIPDDIIERDHIIPKSLGGLNRRDNVHAVHRYCHQQKTKRERSQYSLKKKLESI